MDHPELIAGLVLVDPAQEAYLAALPAEELRRGVAFGDSIRQQHADGELAATIRDVFGPFTRRLTNDQGLQDLILEAHVWCYATRSQARMVRDEHRLVIGSLPGIRQVRAGRTLPDVPVVVFSATTGRPEREREVWTGLNAQLAASVPKGKHVVLADTSHAVNQERPAHIANAIISILDDSQARTPASNISGRGRPGS